MRRPSFRDAYLSLQLYDLRREAEMRKARQMVGTHVLGRTWDEVRPLLDYGHPENAHFRQVTTYWEMAASFVNRGILHPEVFADTCGEALFLYATFEPHIERIREGRPHFLHQLELAVREHTEIRTKLDAVRARLSAPPRA